MASIILSLLLHTLLAYALAYEHAQPRASSIVGGRPALANEYPFVVSLQTRSQMPHHTCSGALVNDHQVITARHCVHGQRYHRFVIRTGSHKYNSGGQVFNISAVKLHPEYDLPRLNSASVYINNDIAIVDLDGRVEGVMPAQLPCKPVEETTAGENVTIMGWGVRNETGSEVVEDMMVATVQAWDNGKCDEMYGDDVPDGVICAMVEGGGVDSCQGDSGGPAVEGNNTIVGIVSSGRGCARPNYAGLYTRVIDQLDFIAKHMTSSEGGD